MGFLGLAARAAAPLAARLLPGAASAATGAASGPFPGMLSKLGGMAKSALPFIGGEAAGALPPIIDTVHAGRTDEEAAAQVNPHYQQILADLKSKGMNDDDAKAAADQMIGPELEDAHHGEEHPILDTVASMAATAGMVKALGGFSRRAASRQPAAGNFLKGTPAMTPAGNLALPKRVPKTGGGSPGPSGGTTTGAPAGGDAGAHTAVDGAEAAMEETQDNVPLNIDQRMQETQVPGMGTTASLDPVTASDAVDPNAVTRVMRPMGYRDNNSDTEPMGHYLDDTQATAPFLSPVQARQGMLSNKMPRDDAFAAADEAKRQQMDQMRQEREKQARRGTKVMAPFPE